MAKNTVSGSQTEYQRGDGVFATPGTTGSLQAANNLSDLDSASTALSNLGIPTPISVANGGTGSATATGGGVSGQFLCLPLVYAPGTSTSVSVTSSTLAAFSSGVMCTNSFVAPASGKVVVGLSCAASIATGGDKMMFALAAVGTVTPVVGNSVTWVSGTSLTPVAISFYVTGLTPGTSYQFDLLGAVLTAASATIIAFGATALSVGNAGAPFVMTVQAV